MEEIHPGIIEILKLAASDTDKGQRQLNSNKDFYRDQLQTPFDEKLVGGTPHPLRYLIERGHNINDYHTPIRILDGSLTIDEAQRIRKKLGFQWQSAPPWMNLRDQYVALSFEDLNPKTGVEIRDPQVLGMYDKEKDQVIEVKGQELTRQFYNGYRRREDDPSVITIWELMRDSKEIVEKEQESSGEPEKE